MLDHPKVDSAFAMHVACPDVPGICCLRKPSNGGVYGFRITLTGQGGHGSRPEKCIDPINTGVHVYLALQELIARGVPGHLRGQP